MLKPMGMLFIMELYAKANISAKVFCYFWNSYFCDSYFWKKLAVMFACNLTICALICRNFLCPQNLLYFIFIPHVILKKIVWKFYFLLFCFFFAL